MVTVRIEFVAPFSEPHHPCGSIVADLNHLHNTSCGDLFGRGVQVREGSGQEVGAEAMSGNKESKTELAVTLLILNRF